MPQGLQQIANKGAEGIPCVTSRVRGQAAQALQCVEQRLLFPLAPGDDGVAQGPAQGLVQHHHRPEIQQGEPVTLCADEVIAKVRVRLHDPQIKDLDEKQPQHEPAKGVAPFLG